MKRFRAFLFAAAVSVGVPALATAQDVQRGGPDRQDRQQRGQAGDQRGERQQPSATSAAQAQPASSPDTFQRQPRPGMQAQAPAQVDQRAQGPVPSDQRRRFAGGEGPGSSAGSRQPAPAFDAAQRGPDNGRDRREAYQQQRQGFDPGRQAPNRGRPGLNDDRNYGRDDRGNGYVRNDGRSDDRRGDRAWQAPGPGGRVGANWRQDRRYDWRGYRDGHRDAFRVGRYAAPRGYTYGYRPFSIGFRLAPYFYTSNYWIDDPYDYRLPPVWGSYRWVRYYDDVLLVDLATGEVIDAIQGFFW